MSADDLIHLWRLEAWPDPGDRSLAAACGGDVRRQAFEGSEQFLRLLASFEAGQIRAAIRLCFDPAEERQDRLGVHLGLATAGPDRSETIERLVGEGPLGTAFSRLRRQETSLAAWALPAGLTCCYEVVRREDAWRPEQERRDRNPFIPPRYYTVAPFEARGDNDWSALDRLMGRFDGPALVEVAVTPADVQAERTWHYRYVTLLMQVNGFGDELGSSATVGGDTVVRTAKVRDPMADDVLRDQEELHRRLREPHVHFAVRCWASRPEDARILAATVAESALCGGRYRLLPVSNAGEAWNALRTASERVQPADTVLCDDVWEGDVRPGQMRLKRLSHLGTVAELKALFRLPVGMSHAAPRTARRHTDPRPVANPARSILIGDDLEIGRPPGRSFPDALGEIFTKASAGLPELRLDLEQLKKHVFIAGVPGSGKTTAMFNLVTQLAQLGVPGLVIEPAKTEYRTFKDLLSHPDPEVRRLASDMRVFTVGNESVSPLRFNPLAYPRGISLDEHIGTVLSCFEAAMPLGGPLQGLLAEAVEEVYAAPTPGRAFPRLKDLLSVARRIVDRKGYEGEVLGNLKAALDVRLGLLVRRSLGRVFDCDTGVPDPAELFERWVVLELDYLPPEHACLVTLFVLSALREHVRVTRRSGSPLAHVTFVEEAHNIVARSAGAARASEETADPKAFAAEYVARMLAEMRALGEGLVIADQLPSAVAPAVVKNTGTKVAHRLVANDDREELGGTMLLDASGVEELGRLGVGEAFLYGEGLHRPRRLRALDSSTYLALGCPAGPDGRRRLPEPPGHARLVELLDAQDWYRQSRLRRGQAELSDVESDLRALQGALARGREALGGGREMLVKARAGQKTVGARETATRMRLAAQEIGDRQGPLKASVLTIVEWLRRIAREQDLEERAVAARSLLTTELLPRAGPLAETLRGEAALLDRLTAAPD